MKSKPSPLSPLPSPLWQQTLFWDRVLIVLLLGWAFFTFTSPIDTKSNDFWWHLSLGKTMVQERLIPTTDLWSHTQMGQPFLNFEWLFEVVLYAAWVVVGINGLIVLKGLFLTAQIALLFWLLRRIGASVLLAVFLSGVWVYFLRYRDYFRPEMVTQMAMVLTMLWMHTLEKRESERASDYGWTALLFCLWANFHGGFLLGIALLGIRTLTSLPSLFTLQRSLIWIKHTTVAAVACLINPYGWKLIIFPFEHMKILVPHHGQVWEVAEWKPPTWSTHEAFYIYVAIVLAWVITAQWQHLRQQQRQGTVRWLDGNSDSRVNEKRESYRHTIGPSPVVSVVSVVEVWLVLGIFGVSAQAYARNIHPFILVSLPILARHAVSIGEWRWVRGVFTAVLVGYLGFQTVDAARYVFGVRVVAADVPVQASQFIRERGLTGQLYNSYSWGGYIGWILGREHPVMMDSRFLFVDLLKEDYLARETPDAWQAYLSKYGVDLALVAYPKGFIPASRKRLSKRPELVFKSEWLALFPPDQWALVFWDSTALVFARRAGADAALIPTLEYRYFRPDAYLEVDAAIRGGKLQLSDVMADIERGARETETNPAARFFIRFFGEGASAIQP